MHATEVIESYVDDTVRLLPRRLRDDVAAELRSLLFEELHARAQEWGGPPDEPLALSLVRAYGRPNEVAARYSPPSAIIDPADSTSFLRAAFIGAVRWPCSARSASGYRPVRTRPTTCSRSASWSGSAFWSWPSGRRTGSVGAGPRQRIGNRATVTG